MERLLFINTNLYTFEGRLEAGWLMTDGKKIMAHGTGRVPEFSDVRVIDATGKNLLPGFIDIHAHGCLGMCTMDGNPESYKKMARFRAEHGVTTWLPTTMTAAKEPTIQAIRAVDSLVNSRGDYAKMPGIHLEGPFLNLACCGAQDTANIRRATIEECREYLDNGTIKRIAFAPEFEENLAAADLFALRGISIAAGHTTAGPDELARAVPHGFNGITHLFNGMRAFNHRDPGTIGAALTDPNYTCELICDNIHSHPRSQRLAWLAKGADGVILITDSVLPAGLPDGAYKQGNETIIVSKGGTELRIPKGNLAGSALTMEYGLRNFTENSGNTLAETWRCSSYNAAKAIGLDRETGSLEDGKLADMVLLNQDYSVEMTVIEGKIIYQKD